MDKEVAPVSCPLIYARDARATFDQQEGPMDKADLTDEGVNKTESPCEAADVPKTPRKKFQAPEISVPVDVLKATNFFQLTDSGSTT